MTHYWSETVFMNSTTKSLDVTIRNLATWLGDTKILISLDAKLNDGTVCSICFFWTIPLIKALKPVFQHYLQ